MSTGLKYSIDLSFEEIRLPPFQDILILAKNSVQGKIGLSKSFELLIPNEFETIEIDDERVEAIFINKRIVKKVPREKIISILRHKVFPFISDGELIRVTFKVNISFSAFETEGV
jgi:hypothetical protein